MYNHRFINLINIINILIDTYNYTKIIKEKHFKILRKLN